MYEKLLSLLGLSGIHKAAMIVTVSSQVVKTLEQEFKDDLEAKNQGIDAIVELLQKQKS